MTTWSNHRPWQAKQMSSSSGRPSWLASGWMDMGALQEGQGVGPGMGVDSLAGCYPDNSKL